MRGQFLEITSRRHLMSAERRALLGSLTDERWFHLAHDSAPDLTLQGGRGIPRDTTACGTHFRIGAKEINCYRDEN